MDFQGFPGGSVVKNLPAKQEIRVGSLSQEDVYSLQCSCLGNHMDREVWQSTVHGVAKESDTI